MSYDLEFDPKPSRGDNGIKQPLLNQGPINAGASLTEIQENLNRVSKNIRTLTNYANGLGKGKMTQQERATMNRVLKDTSD